MNHKERLKNKITLIALSIVTCVMSVMHIVSITVAATVPDYRLQISPTQANFESLKPGEQYRKYFEIQNTGQKGFKYEISIAPYSVTNESYSPDYTVSNGYTEIKDWITIDQPTGYVEAGERFKVEYTINVPNDAPGGGQNASIMVEMVNPDDGLNDSGIIASKQVAYIIYSNVEGTTRRTGEIVTNKVPSFLFDPPVVVSSTVENSGNIYTRASYILEVKAFFGGNTVYTNADDPATLVILPESRRYNELTWEGAPQLGLFKVKQTVKIFDEESVVEKIVFLCPLWFIFAIILFLAIAIFWIINRIRHRKDD